MSSQSVNNREHWYRARLANASGWLLNAEGLLTHAELAWREIAKFLESHRRAPTELPPHEEIQRFFRLIGPFYLTAGFAIENCLKATIVIEHFLYMGRGETNSIPLALEPKVLRSHKLIRLAQAAGVLDEFNGSQRALLAKLSQMVIWRGRYPVPMSAQFQDETGAPGSIDNPGVDPNDWQTVNEIAEVIREKYSEHTPEALRRFYKDDPNAPDIVGPDWRPSGPVTHPVIIAGRRRPKL